MVGSPPPCLAAMMMARLSLLHSLPRLASTAPFLCLIVAQCEWPDMASPPRKEGFTFRETPSTPHPSPARGGLLELVSRLLEPQFFLDLLVMLVGPAPPRLVQPQRLAPGLGGLALQAEAEVD